jgi:hypothetical protein
MSLNAHSQHAASRRAPHTRHSALAISIAAVLPLLGAPGIGTASTAALERRIAEL